MLTRLGYYADKTIELGWLAAAVLAPLFFNVYSSRVFEPDKISLVRSVVLIMLAAWLVKLFEGGVRAYSQSTAPTRTGKVIAATQGAAERGLPSWLGFLRVPMIAPVLIYAAAYLLSSIFTVTPDATIWGSYQRLQGTYSQYSYMLLGFLVIANMRTREQLERLISFMLLTSLPVALYGLLQAARLDPLPWAGDTATRVASSMGNAIFVAAWLIMVVPFCLYRIFHGFSLSIAARRDETAPELAEVDRSRASRASRSIRSANVLDYGWAVVANSFGVLLVQSFAFYVALKIMAGLPYPDARMWFALPAALAVFYAGCWAIEWLGKRRDDPLQRTIYVPVVGFLVFFSAMFAFVFNWSIDRTTITTQVTLDGVGFMWVLFFTLLWGSVATAAFAISGGTRERSTQSSDSGVVRSALNAGYILLLAAQLICIYLTQSRGPWLGLGAGLVTFAVAMWLTGRKIQVRWMNRLGGTVSAVMVALALFVALLNIPGSPLLSLGSIPVVGRGVERLSTITQTDEGTGRVRELIWKGATDLILSDPVRTIIGWGPEAMYVAYSPFYPSQLAQVELRNATPDRSHNVEFDQLVTMGVVGLIAYYFLLGAFFFYAIKIARRAANARDQLLTIALIAVIASHFIEIQTGIQIASTWTYFYLVIGMMVVFGFYLNGYLRPSTSDLEVFATSAKAVADGASSGESLGSSVSTQTRAATLAASSASATATLTGGNGKGSGLPQTGVKGKARTTNSNPQARTSTNTNTTGTQQGRSGGAPADARRRTLPLPSGPTEWVKNPVMLALYGIVAVAAIWLIFAVNVAGVQADTLYKEGLSYDSAQRWVESIQLYEQAIGLQPNQDYYYLFLGRSWLEYSKLTNQEQSNERPALTGQPVQSYKDQAARDAERLYRLQQSEKVLLQAHALNPLNTDHFANLGRLYLDWADPSSTGGNDPTKAPLAVEYMQKARDRTPGNAQLWDELAVAYSRNNQFSQAVDALTQSQYRIDPTFARTPFIRAQLFQERALAVKSDLQAGTPLPTDGESDYGKLVLEAGKAFSDTVALDPGTFADTAQNVQSRVDFLADAAQPFTKTATSKVITNVTALDPQTFRNVLTSTLMAALQQQVPKREKRVADFMKSNGGYNGTASAVPTTTLQTLLQDPAWAAVQTSGGSKEWINSTLAQITTDDALTHLTLGYCYTRTGAKELANQELERASLLSPNNQVLKDMTQPQQQPGQPSPTPSPQP
ncbi:MAG: O-antigen ligase family protein [Chloroflexi bacterium]|nr:O-antigen ligase family protein [Chloroflexota bacterium]